MAKVIEISDLEGRNSNEPIWVLNTSVSSDAGQAGEIHIGIPKQNGTKIDPLFVPQTWLPIEVTKQIPREQLLASSEFRQSINKNLLALIAPESALKILEQEGAKEELTRLDELRRHIRQAGAAKTLTTSKAEVTMVAGGDIEAVADHQKAEVTSDDDSGLAPGFAMFAEKIKGMDDINALNALRSRRRFNRKELAFLKSNLPDKPKSIAAIKTLLSKVKAK